MSGVMTEDRLARLVKLGCGSGRDDEYQSWIRVRRKLSSPVSNIFSLPTPLHERPLQLLSGLEYKSADVALWLSCVEAREQHPLWPWEHVHPASGRHPQLDARLPKVRGLLDIAREAGIDHGVYPGTCIPFVATIDFTLNVGPWHNSRLVHWSCKPRELLDSAPNRARMAERIEMERLYSKEVGAMHVVVDGTQFPRILTANLDWLRPLRSELRETLHSSQLHDYAAALMVYADSGTLYEAKARAAKVVGIESALAENYFRAAAWLSLIDIDLTQPVVWSLPLRRDVSGTRHRMASALLGGLDA